MCHKMLSIVLGLISPFMHRATFVNDYPKTSLLKCSNQTLFNRMMSKTIVQIQLYSSFVGIEPSVIADG